VKNPRVFREKLFWILLIPLVWEITARTGLVPALILPPLEEVFRSFLSESLSGGLLAGTGRSLLYILAGLSAGILSALLLTAGAHLWSPLRSLLEVLISLLHPLPGIALLPVALLVFGVGAGPVFLILLHSVLWPLCISFQNGFDQVPPVFRRIARNYRLSPAGYFFRIMIPAAFPSLFSGLRIAWARSWRALLSAEMIFGVVGGKGGLGWYIFNRRVFMDTPGMYAGLLMLVLLGLAVENLLFGRLEALTIGRWGEK